MTIYLLPSSLKRDNASLSLPFPIVAVVGQIYLVLNRILHVRRPLAGMGRRPIDKQVSWQ